MITIRNIVCQWSTFLPRFHTKQKADHEVILDISQHDQLDSLDSLKDRITEGVFKASPGKRHIPIEVMYQGDGASLYAVYSSSPAYYLYRAECWILQTYANEMASLIADRSSIIELGAGSLEKTQLLLQAVAQAPQIAHGVDYYALDINREALVESLASLPVLKGINCHGLFGTYNDGLRHVAKSLSRSDIEQVPHVFMWLGSSIGNMSVEDALGMVKTIADAMVDGDMILIGLDGWTSTTTIDAAYEPADKLVLNTLVNANEILGQAVFDMSKFVFSTQLNRLEGRNECCCMTTEAIELKYEDETILMERGEKILVVPSHKYSYDQVIDMVKATGCLEVVRRFGTPDDAEVHYDVWMWRKTACQ
ncbi:hypothetical protein BGZ95_008769 [Linnemannia exigua]|uniref:4-dimethylallyltryptophan N-methyltransferase n=1 Tax=Linnemannia exigua TaxID=604196 RepID=A0AAD4H8B5_9FUNG|nr:hypothetical protein BGZ95_008769 [Linnemannia exigua]